MCECERVRTILVRTLTGTFGSGAVRLKSLFFIIHNLNSSKPPKHTRVLLRLYVWGIVTAECEKVGGDRPSSPPPLCVRRGRPIGTGTLWTVR